MGDLVFDCLDGKAEPYAIVPTLLFKLRIAELSGAAIEAIALRVQVRIEAQKRRYAPAEAERLLELFGETARWGETLKPMHFTNASLMAPRFTGCVETELAIPCTYDFEVASAKYFHALDDGEIPFLFLFSGSVFTKTENGFSVSQVPWHKEASYRLPVRVWRDAMDASFPDSGWIRIRRETIDALQRFKARQAMTGWDEALTALLAAREEGT